MRLQKYLAHAGVTSRRRAEELIAAGHVRVNGRIVRELGTSVEDADRVTVDGKRVEAAQHFVYLVINKPVRVMTTLRDPEGRRTVADLLPNGTPRVVPVGRLDYDTSGLLMLTNDGDLAFILTHPRFGVDKTYRARVRGRLSPQDVAALRAGISLEDTRAATARVRVLAARGDESVVDVTIHEGRNRQVRRMFETLGHPVLALERRHFGPLALGSLKPAMVRPVTQRERAALHALAAKARSK